MAEEYYTLPETPVYNAEEIRKIQDSDPVRASTIVNPVIQQIINNLHAVKLQTDVIIVEANEIIQTTYDLLIQLEQVYTKEETEEHVRAAIARHDTDREAHASLHAALSSLESRLNTLELKYGANVTGNPFTVSFGDLTGLVVTGVWNQAYARVEF